MGYAVLDPGHRISLRLKETADARKVGRADQVALLQPVFPLARLLGQNVTVVRVPALELAAARSLKALHRGPFGFLLWHWKSLVPPLLRREHHSHVASLELGVGFDLSDIRQTRRYSVEHRLPQLQMRHLPAAEHHGHLDLVAVAQKLAGMPGLEIEVVIVDTRTVLYFLQLNDVLLLLCRPRRLGLLELEFPVVHDLDYRGPSGGSHLHEIQSAFHRRCQSFLDRQNTELLTRCRDHPDWADPDHAIDANPLFTIVRGQLHASQDRNKKAPGKTGRPRPKQRGKPTTSRFQARTRLRCGIGPAGSGWRSWAPRLTGREPTQQP